MHVTDAHAMTSVAPTVARCLGLRAPRDASEESIAEIVKELEASARLAILAPDALGEAAFERFCAAMPFLRSLWAERHVTLRSEMPSITPVNFATMVTGTDLEGHGVRTYDHDFQVETLFDVLRAAGKRSAAAGLEGYTGSKLLARYSDIDGTTELGSDDKVADMVIRIAEAQRPAYIIAQLGRVDDVFHQFGPSSPGVVPMLRATDARLQRLVEHLKPLGYGVIILADHGQHDIVDDPTTTLKGSHGSDSDQDCQVPCTWL